MEREWRGRRYLWAGGGVGAKEAAKRRFLFHKTREPRLVCVWACDRVSRTREADAAAGHEASRPAGIAPALLCSPPEDGNRGPGRRGHGRSAREGQDHPSTPWLARHLHQTSGVCFRRQTTNQTCPIHRHRKEPRSRACQVGPTPLNADKCQRTVPT
ncbi:hypothetical protein PVAP13_5KG019350 [Panicum virgatum]|uniref:Uncharacterized protein n=1 Tax=Panicum virgatum TaxID=38727 RepID=A0A8T0S9D9_PANVG|nr:hypothetical protein PVAP13_5KG019350 [Panicum virgatum]